MNECENFKHGLLHAFHQLNRKIENYEQYFIVERFSYQTHFLQIRGHVLAQLDPLEIKESDKANDNLSTYYDRVENQLCMYLHCLFLIYFK